MFARVAAGTVKVEAPGGTRQTNSVLALLRMSTPPPAMKTVEVAATPVQLRVWGWERVTELRLFLLVQVKADGITNGTLKAATSAPPDAESVKFPELRKRVLGMAEMEGMAPPKNPEKAPEEGAMERTPASSPLPVGRMPVRLGTSPGL